MPREEDQKLLAELMFVSEQMKNQIKELQALDGIAARAAALNEVDTEKILENLNRVSLTRISHEIIKNLKEELQKSRNEIITAAAGAEAAAKELSKQSENLRLASDSFLNLDNMSDDLNTLVSNVKNWKTKTIYGATALGLFFGLLSGVLVSNIGTLLSNSPTPQIIQNAELLTPKFGKIAVLPDEKNKNKFYLAFGAKELTQVEFLEENGVKYIVLHSQK